MEKLTNLTSKTPLQNQREHTNTNTFLLPYLDSRDRHTYKNTWTLLQRVSGSPLEQLNHNRLVD